MDDFRARRLARQKNATIKRVLLHDNIEHHSFHLELNDYESWELLAKMTQDEWKNTMKCDTFPALDKTKIRKITLEERYQD